LEGIIIALCCDTNNSNYFLFFSGGTPDSCSGEKYGKTFTNNDQL
jgi:hypothetical protein